MVHMCVRYIQYIYKVSTKEFSKLGVVNISSEYGVIYICNYYYF